MRADDATRATEAANRYQADKAVGEITDKIETASARGLFRVLSDHLTPFAAAEVGGHFAGNGYAVSERKDLSRFGWLTVLEISWRPERV